MSLPQIEGIIWDLDGTLYRFDEVFKEACNHAAAKSACAMRPEFAYDDAYARSVKSEIEHGFSLQWFHQETKLSFQDMHFVYHDSIDEKVIAANEEMSAGLRALSMPSVILTNASRGWVLRILAHLGINDLFPENRIVALEDAGFVPKSRGPAGFELALARLGLPASSVLMVEDLSRNLTTAKSLGLRTALVHHGQWPDDRRHIDYLYDSTLDLVRDLLAQKQAQ